MTEEIKTPEEVEAEFEVFKNGLIEQNEYDLTKRTVTFVGGGAHGSQFDIPNGVTELSAETAYGDEKYVRNPENDLEFIPA